MQKILFPDNIKPGGTRKFWNLIFKNILGQPGKDSKEVMRDIKKIYKAPTKEAAEKHLDDLEEKWNKKYPVVIRSWRNNWHKLSTFFKYSEDIRRLIYTTNTI